MDMRRFIGFMTVKVEAVWTASQDGRHCKVIPTATSSMVVLPCLRAKLGIASSCSIGVAIEGTFITEPADYHISAPVSWEQHWSSVQSEKKRRFWRVFPVGLNLGSRAVMLPMWNGLRHDQNRGGGPREGSV